MALWFWLFSLLQLFVLAQSQTIDQFNQTDLQAAMADMRGKSYHGFVILLKILEASPNTLNSQDITFLMPTDDKVSDIALTPAHLEDFILSHSIPMGLLYGNMLHFPNGTLVPSGMPNRMLRTWPPTFELWTPEIFEHLCQDRCMPEQGNFHLMILKLQSPPIFKLLCQNRCIPEQGNFYLMIFKLQSPPLFKLQTPEIFELLSSDRSMPEQENLHALIFKLHSQPIFKLQTPEILEL